MKVCTRCLKNLEGDINLCQCESEPQDIINHPKHYNESGAYCECGRQIECIDVTRNMEFAAGNAIKYLWRYKHKNGLEDLKKALWYVQDLINNLPTKSVHNSVNK